MWMLWMKVMSSRQPHGEHGVSHHPHLWMALGTCLSSNSAGVGKEINSKQIRTFHNIHAQPTTKNVDN